jgi:hypothetical protein
MTRDPSRPPAREHATRRHHARCARAWRSHPPPCAARPPCAAHPHPRAEAKAPARQPAAHEHTAQQPKLRLQLQLFKYDRPIDRPAGHREPWFPLPAFGPLVARSSVEQNGSHAPQTVRDRRSIVKKGRRRLPVPACPCRLISWATHRHCTRLPKVTAKESPE